MIQVGDFMKHGSICVEIRVKKEGCGDKITSEFEKKRICEIHDRRFVRKKELMLQVQPNYLSNVGFCYETNIDSIQLQKQLNKGYFVMKQMDILLFHMTFPQKRS